MVLIGMNCCRGRPKGQVILLDFLQQWQITRLDYPLQIAYQTSREKRFMGLPNDLLIIILALTMIPISFDHVNFFRPQVTILTTTPNIMDNVHMQQMPSSSSKLLSLLSQGHGLELKESICVDDQWRFEHCPPNSAIQCSTRQKITTLKCKARINLYKFVNGTPTPCYSGFWV
jgi:hypothetical protein